ncbi:MAG: redox-regulated ATPase YchF [Candidatus Taylorbacteria bacterium]|nr:redox-regulated ATPase YchF [Candidatus Taylorbacteria bacterium]
MSLSIGIVGLPNVGKSTLFNALTKQSVPAENYPFCTIDPSVGVVAVPDPRLAKLSEFSKSAKTVPAAVEFVDIAGLVKGAAEGQGLGNKFLSHIREVDAIAEVVRVFEDKDIIHVAGKVEPLNDVEVINLELVLADLETVSKRLQNLGKEVKTGKKEALIERDVLERFRKALESGRLTYGEPISELEAPYVKHLQLLTQKPILYVLNVSATDAETADKRGYEKPQTHAGRGISANLRTYLRKSASPYVEIDPIFGTGLETLISKAYEVLGLMTYFTTGEDETRAWTIEKGSAAPAAGAAIHGDFREKFIRAEVIPWDTLLAAGSYAAAREKGLVRTEGKKYVVKDGDVVEFKI